MCSTDEIRLDSRLERRFLRLVPWAILVLVIVFAMSSVIPRAASGTQDETFGWVNSAALGLILLLAALWFIACFTGCATAKKHQAFIFAYAFTFGSFALLVTPFVGSDDRRRSDSEGVIQLLRGCMASPAAGGIAVSEVSMVTRCPHPSWVGKDGLAPGSEPASAARATGPTFAWLVSIGGVTARTYRTIPQSVSSEGGAGTSPPSTLPGTAKPAAAGSRDGKPTATTEEAFVEVHGGLVVPLFVVVLAFIGGAVSLSRRIPEYQRRSEKGYVPTDREPAMAAFQARESVVFQVMQLTSAPFLAIATWYMFGPTTLATAAAIAFATGFASEHILLMIRGMVEGIRPEGSRMQPPKAVELQGVVVDVNKQPAANATVTLEEIESGTSRTSLADGKGEFAFANVRTGKVRLLAKAGPLQATADIVVGDKPPRVTLTLA